MSDTDDLRPIFYFTDQTYVEALWYVSWKDGDWMAAVYRDTPAAPWRATYRFRYYVDELDPFESQDRKSATHMRANETDGDTDAARARLVAAMDMVANMTATHYAASIINTNWRAVVQGSSTAALKLLGQQSFGHCKVAASEPGRPQ